MGAEPKPWVTPPRHDVKKVSRLKKLEAPFPPLELVELDLDGVPLRYCYSSPESLWRIETLFTKEPGTIDWLHSFAPEDVFVDIGANVGMYSMYAGVVSRARVFAFEPESQNYAELCRSIFLNQAQGRILGYCAAIGDKPLELSRLLLSRFSTGGSFHDFGEPSRDYAADARFAQGSVAFALDHLVDAGAVPPPDHVKIDVDGHEHKVIAGMKNLLQRGLPRSLLLECDAKLPNTRAAVDWLLSSGWLVSPDQLRLTREGLRPAGAVMDELKKGSFTGNIVFARRAGDLDYATRALERFSAADLEKMRLPG
jgi:FkbM family methyltransferase